MEWERTAMLWSQRNIGRRLAVEGFWRPLTPGRARKPEGDGARRSDAAAGRRAGAAETQA